MDTLKKIFPAVTKLQTVEFAQVLILGLIALSLYYKNHNLIITALVVTFVSLVVPAVFRPFAIGWFGLSKIISAISSRILMSIVFFVIVAPVGLFRRLTGVDNLKIRQFKKSRQSAMVNRDHLYNDADLTNTF